MPKWTADSDGKLRIIFLSREDWVQFVNSVVKPTGRQFGLDVEIKPFKKKETVIEVVRP